MTEILSSNFNNLLSLIISVTPKLFAGLVVFFFVIYAGKFINELLSKIFKKAKLLEIHSHLYLKISKIFFLFIAIILFLSTVGLKSIAAGLFAGGGIVTVILGFAFREIGENLLSGILLSFKSPFKKGDLIKSGNFEGIVKAIEIRSTHIRSYDGQDIFIPSAQIYKNTLINYTKDGLRRFTISLGISYENDLNMACVIINQELEKIKGIIKTPKASVAFNQFLPNYLEIQILFWVNVFSSESNVGKIKTELAANIKEELIASGFSLSFEIPSNVNFKLAHDLDIPEGGIAH